MSRSVPPRRDILPVEEEELRAVEPHPVGAAAQRDVRLLGKLDVRQEKQSLSVTRHRRQPRELRQVTGPLRVGLPPPLVLPDRLLRGVEDDHSFLAVDDHHLRRLVLLRSTLDPYDRRDPQGARRDRGVGRPASHVGGEAENGTLEDLCGVRRERSWATMITGSRIAATESTGGRRGFPEPGGRSGAGRVPLPQVRILDPMERLQEVLENLVERPVAANWLSRIVRTVCSTSIESSRRARWTERI